MPRAPRARPFQCPSAPPSASTGGGGGGLCTGARLSSAAAGASSPAAPCAAGACAAGACAAGACAADACPLPSVSCLAPPNSSSLNVFRAVTGVRNSCDASATNRRSTSRSWRRSRTVDSSLPAIALNCRPSSPISPLPVVGARAARSPLPMRAADAVRPSIGAVDRRPNTNASRAASTVAARAAMMNGPMIVSSASLWTSGLRAIST